MPSEIFGRNVNHHPSGLAYLPKYVPRLGFVNMRIVPINRYQDMAAKILKRVIRGECCGSSASVTHGMAYYQSQGFR